MTKQEEMINHPEKYKETMAKVNNELKQLDGEK